MRLNKHGIPVLDPPGRNGIKSAPKCLPNEHTYEPGKLVGEKIVAVCTRCGEKDVQNFEDLPARRKGIYRASDRRM